MKNYKECAKVYQTNNEELFRFMDNNRIVDKSNVNKIQESILKYGFLNQPILVSKDFQIIDGQHRYEAWRQMDKDTRPQIKFIIETSDNDIEHLCKLTNLVSKSWKDIDFVRFYANSNIENAKDYQDILDLLEYCEKRKFKVTVMFIVSLLSRTDNSEMIKAVKNGHFVSKNTKVKCYSIIDRMLKFKEVLNTKELSKAVFNHKPFRMALIRLLNTEGVDETRLLNTINLKPLTRCITVNDYLLEIQTRYNRGKRKDRLQIIKER